MAPPSRSSQNLRAAKLLEASSEELLTLTPSIDGITVASKINSVYQDLQVVIDVLTAVKDSCDVGANSYPSYPRVREAMLTAGNEVYRVKQELRDLREQFLTTRSDDLIAYREFGKQLADLASRLRAVVFVAAPRKSKKEESAK